MSNLLEQASLVMIPSGYKEDVVYSVIPTSGAGDLTFTRASNGTRINSDGNVEVVPWNMVQYSEDFTNAYWGKDNSTITANSTTAPNGTTTADTFTRNAGTAYLYNGSFNLGVGQFTQSVYAKANASSSIRLEFVTGAFNRGAACIFDLSNGTAGTITIYGGVSGFTASIESVGNGWYRCSLGGTITIADTYFWEISITTGSIYVWGAQINIGSTAKPYFPTTDRLNVPRLTYQNGGGGCPSLLLEKQSTNDLVYSEQFDNAGWSKEEATSTANQTTSPDGTQNADTIIDNSTSGRHILYQQFSGNLATSRTFSLYAKQNSLRYLFMSVTNTGDTHCYSAIFDLQSGTVSATKVNGDATLSASIVSAGNGWYRCIISGTMTTGTANYFPLIGTSDRAGFTGSLYANNSPIYSGSGQSIYIYGAQLEASSYATSYIPTTSTSATRVKDVCYKNSISSLIGQSSGVVFADIVPFQFLDGSYIGISDNASVSNRQIFGFEGQSGNSGTLRFYGFYTGDYGTFYAGQRYKIAMAYANNDFVVYVNGTQVVNQTSGTVTGTLSHFGFDSYVSSSQNFQGQVNEAILFPTRLTNSELAQLTGNQNYTINQAYESYGVASESPNCVQP